MGRRIVAPLALFLLLCPAFGFFGCIEPLPPGRGPLSQPFETPAKRDFGLEIYTYVEREARLHPTLSEVRELAVKKLKDDLIVSINTMIPSNLLGDLDTYMRTLLPFYDDGTLPELTRGLASLLSTLSEDKEFLSAVALFLQRQGMNPMLRKDEISLIQRALSYGKILPFLQRWVAWARFLDGLQDDGKTPAPEEKTLLRDFLDRSGEWLQRTNRREDAPEQRDLLSEILLVEDPRLDLQTGVRCAIRLDSLGQPLLTEAGKEAQRRTALPEPFATPQTPGRGSCGEAIDTQGRRLFDTRDLSKTIFGSLLAETRQLLLRELPLKDAHTPFPFNLTVGIRPMLEPRDPQTGGYSAESPILRTLKNAFPLLLGRDMSKLVRGLGLIIDANQPKMASFLALLGDLALLSSNHKTDVSLDNTLMQDLLPILQILAAKPGFLEDLLKTLQTPGLTAKLKKSLTDLMRFKGKLSLEDYNRFVAGDRAAVFKTNVDAKSPDTPTNSSYMQRLLHLLADVNRHKYESRLKSSDQTEIPFLEMRISNLADLYLRSVIGTAEIWETIYVNGNPIEEGFLKDQLRLSLPAMGLSERPNPEELGIFLNRPLVFKDVPLIAGAKLTIVMDPIIGRDGYDVPGYQGDSVLASLAAGLVARDGGTLKPIALVFQKHGILPLLLDLFQVLHRHWGSAQHGGKTKPGALVYPSPQTNLRSLESFLVEAFETTDFLEQIESWGGLFLNAKVSSQPQAESILPVFQTYLTYVCGKPQTAFGQTLLGRLWDSLTAMAKSLDGDEKKAARDAWFGAIQAFKDLVLLVDGKGSQATFKNSRAPVVLAKGLSFFADEIERRDKAGRWGPDLKQIEDTLRDLLTDPMIPLLLDLIDSFTQDRDLLRLGTEWLVHLFPEPSKEPLRFNELLATSASLLAPMTDDLRVPLFRTFGRLAVTQKKLIAQGLGFLHKTLPLDAKGTFLLILQNGAVVHPKRDTFASALLLILLRDLHRLQPGSALPTSDKDLQQILQTIARFVVDSKSGLEKFYEIVKRRGSTTP